LSDVEVEQSEVGSGGQTGVPMAAVRVYGWMMQ
jgi:hypothetical protein